MKNKMNQQISHGRLCQMALLSEDSSVDFLSDLNGLPHHIPTLHRDCFSILS